MRVSIEDTVIATFDEEELFMRLDGEEYENVAAYIIEHDLTDIIVLSAVDWLRDWYDDHCDKEWWAMKYAFEYHIGKKKYEELVGYEEDWDEEEA